MTNKQKPRICDILGVEVGEPFTIEGVTLNGTAIVYYIQSDGRFATIPSLAMASSYYIMDAINDPTLVKHIEPTFSDDEKAFLRIMKRIGFAWFSRDTGECVTYIEFWQSRPTTSRKNNGMITICDGDVDDIFISVPVGCLPRIVPGKIYCIDEVLQRGGIGNEQS